MKPWSLIGRLPLSLLYLLSVPVYLLLCHVLRYRRQVVLTNLANAFPEQSVRQRRKLAGAFYKQLVQLAVEILHTRKMTRDSFRQRITLTNSEIIEEPLARGPIIVATLHKGNSEWALHALHLSLGKRLDPVFKPPHDTRLDRYLRQTRGRFGARPIATNASGHEWRETLRSGHSLCLLADQAPVAGQPARSYEFLNQETSFHTGLERIARLSGYPVFFADINRVKRGRYAIEFTRLDAVTGNQPADLMASYASACEKAIRRQPESWLWSHRRWRKPRSDSDERFSQR